VGKLDNTGVAGHQPRGHQQVDHRVVIRTSHHEPAWNAAANRLTLLARGDQPEEEVAQDLSLLR
jgi:hypothetical protein